MKLLKNKAARYLIPERIPGFAASLYDKAARTAISRYYARIAEEIIATIDSGMILDIGTGPGYLPIEIAKRRANIRIKGIDLTQQMIKIAKRNAREAGMTEQLNFEVGDANKLTFEDNTYDMLISTGTFHSWKDPIRVMNECYRVLKPGKETWIYDPARITAAGSDSLWMSLRGWDWITFKWLTLLSRIEPAERSLKEIQEMVSRTDFRAYEVKENDWIHIRLRK